MNSIKIKLIYHYLLDRNNRNKGSIDIFTLVVVFLIIGLMIGANIIITKYLNQGCCKGLFEGRNNIILINKNQNLIVTETGKFADNFDALALDNLSGGNIDFRSSKYYTYIIKSTKNYALIQAIPKAIPKDSSSQEKNQYESGGNLKVYIGAVLRLENSDNQLVTREIVCQAEKVGQVIDPADIVLKDKKLQCPEGSERL